MIFTSPYPPVSIPDVPFDAFVLERAMGLGEKPALIDGPSGRTLTYRALAEGVDRVAAGLVERGLRKGDVLAIFAPNQPEYALAFYGALRAGGAVTTLSSLATVEDLVRQLRDSGARILVTVAAFLDRARPAALEAGIEEILTLDAGEGATPLSRLLETRGPVPRPGLDPAEDLAAIPYSSGTTGLAKGVMLTHRNLVANVLQTAAGQRISEEDRIIAVMPFFHIYGMVVVMSHGLREGATLVTSPRFELEGFLALLDRHKVTRAYVAPPAVLLLARHPAVDRHDLSNLRAIMSGAAPLDAELQTACSERLGCLVLQGYGMTESSPVSHLTPDTAADIRPGTVGPLAASTEGVVVDIVTGERLGPGQDGEIRVRGPQVMKGYLNRPDDSAATVDAEGWLHTGDIGHVDAEGYFSIVDRLKELIKYKGYQVPPAELEALLLGHPAVADAAVIGIPDEAAGEVPKAFVVLKGAVSNEELMSWVAERVAPYKKIRMVEVIDAIPKSPSGKILRRALKR